ncbi:unnamed protein product [Gongylonema pulchrum]|uniref:LysR_substrate domain-containing protein n=1 Tax=Gongylonema pulchrum TaxID=637853 RepID=A0A183EE82_9BILA|nr:unnamed protein product [Gongylonema pulchrum]
MDASCRHTSISPLSLSRLCLGGEIVQLPTVLVEQESMFRAVITKDAYRSLSIEAQNYLKVISLN